MRNSLISFLKEKNELEQKSKSDELKIRKQELQIQRDQFQVEKEERRQRLLYEQQEKTMLLQIFKECFKSEFN